MEAVKLPHLQQRLEEADEGAVDRVSKVVGLQHRHGPLQLRGVPAPTHHSQPLRA